MKNIWRARSAIKPSRNGSADPSNRPRATMTRKMSTKNKMSVPFHPQQKTAPLVTKTMKVVRTTSKMMVSTTAKTLCSTMPKTTMKKLHWATKTNRHRWIRRRVLTKKYEYDNGTGAKDTNYEGESGGDKNTGAGGGSAEWLNFLSRIARTEALVAMAKAKVSLSTASRKKTNL